MQFSRPFDDLQALFFLCYAVNFIKGKVAPAAELSKVATVQQMLCLHDNKYKVVLLRAYDNNKFIGSAVTNGWRARMSQMSYEVYMVPDPTYQKSALQQVGEVVFGMSNEGLAEFRRIWIKNMTKMWRNVVAYRVQHEVGINQQDLVGLGQIEEGHSTQVTDPNKWSTSSGSNRRFLESLFDAAKTHRREIGIITNKDEFNQITGGIPLGRSDVRLWYLEDGCDEKKADLEYFAPFGDWTAMDARQYCAAAQVCGMTVNKSVVSPWSFPIRK